jgi:hypothetical protein
MKKTSPFVISEFTNPSGEIVYRLYARIDGQRIRKNFSTLAEAQAEREIQEVNWLQRDTGTRAAITRLNEDQLHEAEAAFRRLMGQPRSLSFYLDFALTNYREPEKQRPLANAVADYIAAKEHEFAQDQLSPPQLARIRWDLKRLVKYFPGKTVAEITVSGLVGFLERRRPGMKTFNNQRGVLGTFFKFCFHRGWVTENPVLKVPHYRIRHKRGVAQPTTDWGYEFASTENGLPFSPEVDEALDTGIGLGLVHTQVCAGYRYASCNTDRVALTKVQTLRFCVRGKVSQGKSNVATLRKSFP